MTRFTTLRFIGVLLGFVLLLGLGVLLLLRAAFRPGARLALNIDAGQPGSRSNTVLDKVVRHVLKGKVGLRSLVYLGGRRVRLENLQLMLGGRVGGDKILVSDAELQLDLPGFQLQGYLDIGSIARTVLHRYLSAFTLMDSGKFPAQVMMPLDNLETLKNWKFSAELAGQQISWEPLPLLDNVLFRVDRGKISYAGGSLTVKDLHVSQGSNTIDLNLKISELQQIPFFEPSTMGLKFDLAQLIKRKGDTTRLISQGFVNMGLSVKGPVEHPKMNGEVNGAVELPFIPLAVDTAGMKSRSVEMGAKSFKGSITGGDSDAVIALASTSAQQLRTVFHSKEHTFGYYSEAAEAKIGITGSWKNPKVRQALNFENGVVNYGHIVSTVKGGGSPDDAANTTHFPYEHLGMEIIHDDAGIEFNMLATKFLSGTVTSKLRLDPTKKPAVTYTFNGTNLSLEELFNVITGPEIAVSGRVDVNAIGDATALAFHVMVGKGTGTLRNFNIIWNPKVSGRPEILNVAGLISQFHISSCPVEFPVFGRGVYLTYDNTTAIGKVHGKLGITQALRCDGRFEYTFNPQILAANPAASRALLHMGYTGVLVVSISGPMGEAKVHISVPRGTGH